MYPRLSTLLAEGWLTDGWETTEEAAGRPPRRYYELTDNGKRGLGAVLAKAKQDSRFRRLNLKYTK
jgi:PadR family transcriptional regulator PadR